MKPVFGFNSSHISIRGGHLQSFCEVSRSLYVLETQADDHKILISIPENVTQDVSGNRNVASNVLQVRHYSVPVISTVLSTFATVSFAVTASAAGVLTLSTAGLQSVGSFSAPSSSLTSDPARNLFRSPFAPALAEALRDRVFGADDSERQLHIIYLANDILFDRR